MERRRKRGREGKGREIKSNGRRGERFKERGESCNRRRNISKGAIRGRGGGEEEQLTTRVERKEHERKRKCGRERRKRRRRRNNKSN